SSDRPLASDRRGDEQAVGGRASRHAARQHFVPSAREIPTAARAGRKASAPAWSPNGPPDQRPPANVAATRRWMPRLPGQARVAAGWRRPNGVEADRHGRIPVDFDALYDDRRGEADRGVSHDEGGRWEIDRAGNVDGRFVGLDVRVLAAWILVDRLPLIRSGRRSCLVDLDFAGYFTALPFVVRLRGIGIVLVR